MISPELLNNPRSLPSFSTLNLLAEAMSFSAVIVSFRQIICRSSWWLWLGWRSNRMRLRFSNHTQLSSSMRSSSSEVCSSFWPKSICWVLSAPVNTSRLVLIPTIGILLSHTRAYDFRNVWSPPIETMRSTLSHSRLRSSSPNSLRSSSGITWTSLPIFLATSTKQLMTPWWAWCVLDS